MATKRSGERSRVSGAVASALGTDAAQHPSLNAHASGASTDLFAQVQTMGHEQVLLSHDPSCGYLGIIAIHDTTLGPALGGTRFWRYANTHEAVT
ncbi:MAG TPA: Glu/Leu/Phe/Val dehydrogenase dimerization domain-containing protein, partial [Gemmatimonadales bacterium]